MHPPLKRHPSLQPFSRDHYQGLVAAQRLLRAAGMDSVARRAALAAFIPVWQSEISPHFDEEERLLLDLVPDAALKERLMDEHAALRALAGEAGARAEIAEPDAAWVERLGILLNDHIRWEERSLFPEIERTTAPGLLAALAESTTELDTRRPRSCAVNMEETGR